MKYILIVNGPNMNLLGKREPEIYGSAGLADLEARLTAEAASLGCGIESFQSNHEGAIIDRLQAAMEPGRFAGVILNPGGLTHTSVSIRDCVAALPVPTIEVHLSNIFAREEFRGRSMIAPVCAGVITGLGFDGYLLALRHLASRAS
ncbi:MAG TPA: type II 3-dehydroquinate dehydratase [Candidatus Ozemobacteraceae bacterium]|nr:type II 3-dehydroquinate dehydratase [Candidatus Ozemobacteraceae bacterium]